MRGTEVTDRNFDFPRVYQQKPLIEGVRVLKGAPRRAFQHTHRRRFLEAGTRPM